MYFKLFNGLELKNYNYYNYGIFVVIVSAIVRKENNELLL